MAVRTNSGRELGLLEGQEHLGVGGPGHYRYHLEGGFRIRSKKGEQHSAEDLGHLTGRPWSQAPCNTVK